MDYRIYLNSTLISDKPQGFDKVALSIERDGDLDAVFYKYSSPLTFVGDGYDILKAQYDNSYCGSVTIQIDSRCNPEGTYTSLFDGIIQLSKCTFNLNRCSVDVTLTDDTISAKIANNWRVSGVINTDRSIEQGSITPATDIDLDLFTPSTGTYDKTGRMAYSVYEAFKWLVAYMTDDTVGFASNTFGGGGDYEYWYITTGISLHDTANETAPDISFEDLYDNISKLIPLGFWIEDNAGTPQIRIEERSYFYSNTNVLTMRNIGGDGLQAKVAEDKLYAKVEMGTQIYTKKDETGGPFNFVDNTFFGWKPAEYGFNIGCNIDNTLDLRTEFICDNNTIEDILVNSNDEYDDEVVLIIGEEYSLGQYRAIKYDEGTGGENYYNDPTTQYQVAQRWQAYMPGSFSKWTELSTVDNTCEVFGENGGTATTTKADLGGNDPSILDTEIFDNGGNFDSATNYRYTCPADGLFAVQLLNEIEVSNDTGFEDQYISVMVTITLRHRDSLGNDLNTVSRNTRLFEFNTIGGPVDLPINGTFLASSTDYFDMLIEVEVLEATGQMNVGVDSTFKVVTAPDTVVDFIQTASPRIKQYEWTYPISDTDWANLKQGANKTITINTGNDTDNDIVVWLQRIDYEPNTGLANIIALGQ